jgi:GT2 family glycosyltransferase
MTVYIGIVTHNSLADLPTLFEGLRSQTYSNTAIIVVDNTSSDASVSWIKANVSSIKLVINPRNIGFGRAHNQILRLCKFQPDDFYMALNPDVILLPNYIARLIETLDMTGAAWGTGKLLLLNGSSGQLDRLYSVGQALYRNGYGVNIGYNLPDDGTFQQSRAVFGAPGAAAIYSKALIDAVSSDSGFFDETIFMYGEDTDLDWRARLQGFSCWYCADAVAFHRGSNPSDRMRIEALSNRYISVIKNAFLLDLLIYNLPLIALHIFFRLIFTPRQGLFIANRLIRTLPKTWQKHRKPAVSRHVMLKWFAWSKAQTTGQPRSLVERLQAFLLRSFWAYRRSSDLQRQTPSEPDNPEK